MLVDDDRIDPNYRKPGHYNILQYASLARNDRLSVYKILLACKRLDPTLADDECSAGTASAMLRKKDLFECADLVDAYARDPDSVRERLRHELGYTAGDAGELFATVVLLCDDYLKIKDT